MTTPDPATTYAAFYARIKTASAGGSVRAALGAGATSVIPADDLKQTLPAFPFVAFAGGEIADDGVDVSVFRLTWYIYDSTLYRYSRINPLITLIRAAYPHDWLTNAFTKIEAVTAEKPDPALDYPVRGVPFTVRIRQ